MGVISDLLTGLHCGEEPRPKVRSLEPGLFISLLVAAQEKLGMSIAVVLGICFQDTRTPPDPFFSCLASLHPIQGSQRRDILESCEPLGSLENNIDTIDEVSEYSLRFNN